MPEINVIIRDKVAVANGPVYICGNSDYTLAFEFDEEWGEYEIKTARFVYGEKYTDVVFSGNTCQVPVLTNLYGFKVGVFAGDLHTTTPAKVAAKKSILCDKGAPADPEPDVYNQIIEAINATSAKVTETDDGVNIELTDIHGKTEALVKHGKDGPVGATGPAGADGKSAYQYAQDGGYTGTEEDFAKKLAEEYPTKLSEFENDLYGGIRREEVVSLSKADFTPFEDIGDVYIGTSVLGLPSDPAEIGYEMNISVSGMEVHQTEADVPVVFSADEGAYFIQFQDSPAIVFLDGVNLEDMGIGTGTGFLLISPASMPSMADSFTLSLYRSVVAEKIPAQFVDFSDMVFADFVGTGSFSMNKAASIEVGEYSHTEGKDSAATGEASHAEGVGTKADGSGAHTEGIGTTTLGPASHAEGEDTVARSGGAHAEGKETAALHIAAHAEGKKTTASGAAAHAEGNGTTASGAAAHAEGRETTAEGDRSHTEGSGTTAMGRAQHVQGEYNAIDPDASSDKPGTRGKYAHIVGNGTADAYRSNAHTLDWNGNAWFAGGVILTSPDGTRYKITVENGGTLNVAATTD